MLGVPLSTPELAFSDMPAGRDPPTRVYVPVSDAASVSEHAVPLVRLCRVVDVDQTGRAATIMVNVRSATRFDSALTVFLARIVNVLVPAVVTVPLSAPEDDRLRPAGSEPDCRT